MPRVSILLPTHNRADVLGAAIQSVLDQTEADFELLIVADGCTDGTAALVADIRDPRIRFFDLPKAPHFGYANRNIALRTARGELVAFAAHDDLLFADHLRLLIDRLESTGKEWIYSRPLWVSTDGTIVPYATNLMLGDELGDFLTVGNTIPASCVLFRRECLDRVGHWPEDVPSAADWRHWIAIIESGRRTNLAYLPVPTCLHFSADWRKSRHAGAREVETLLGIADRASWWPACLRYDMPADDLGQHTIGRAMRDGGAAWRDDLRAAVEVVLDRVAWDDVRRVRPQLTATIAELEQALAAGEERVKRFEGRIAAADSRASEAVTSLSQVEEELRRTRGQLDACQLQLSSTLGSSSWRITAPLRALKRRVSGIA